ncbi:hypothetical protein BDB00DRAFT_875888 [Zychaea mexicana]|uniref:uncharacterized protein n=1 Tax=Zychaea mexicana TaxID=64656 RepID=UPI0022FF1CFE|nr:uncharacterized protein BDB00DRAFT_875888 [Zychaea mexicana]KAI9489923.1 hypothetical protein BDB00DRAFT_875888 [Zychaea mexicana]
MERLNDDRSVNFVNELPYDVLITILSSLTTEDLVDFTPHVQQLRLQLPSLSNWYNTPLTRIAQGLFPRLEVLQLNALHLQNTDTLMLALGEVANTLKELLLTTEHNPNAVFIPLCTVLSICHKLKHFIYTHDAETETSLAFGQMPTHTLQLTDFNFSIYYPEEHIDSTMATLLQHCTHLQRLTLTCNDGDEVLPAIQQHCKQLEYLRLHDILNYQARPSTITSGDCAQSDPDPPSSLNLHSVTILRTRGCADIMIPYLARSTETLTELYINLRPIAVPTWDPLLTWGLPNLRCLTLSYGEVDNNGFVADLITHLPLLEEVHLEECEYIGLHVFNALAQLDNLKSLSIDGVIGAEEDSLADMFLTFSQRGVDGPLKSVTFDMCHDFIDTYDVLQSLADVESVQEIGYAIVP